MKIIELEESTLKNFFRKVFDTKGFVVEGAHCVGFVTGTVTMATYFDKMEFRQIDSDTKDFASLYARISKAMKYLPEGKITIHDGNIIIDLQ